MFDLFLLVVGLIVSSGFTSMSEAALFSVNLSRVYLARDEGRIGARRLLSIKQDIQRPVATLVILNNIINISGSIFVGGVASETFGSAGAGIFAGVLTLLVILFAEIVPKTIGERYSLTIGLTVAAPLLALTRLFAPLIWLIERVTKPFAGKVDEQEGVTSEDEIRLLASLGKDEGLITQHESELIRKAFHLDDVTAQEIMTHRMKLATLDGDLRLSDLDLDELGKGYSRILVTEDGDIDRVNGVVYQRDLLLALARGETDKRIEDLKHPPNFVHEATPAHKLLVEFQHTHQHLFVVLDEYGGTSGVVSLEDVLEELVGEILDETDARDAAEGKRIADSAGESTTNPAETSAESENPPAGDLTTSDVSSIPTSPSPAAPSDPATPSPATPAGAPIGGENAENPTA